MGILVSWWKRREEVVVVVEVEGEKRVLNRMIVEALKLMSDFFRRRLFRQEGRMKAVSRRLGVGRGIERIKSGF